MLGAEEFVERLKKQFLLNAEPARKRPRVRQILSAKKTEQVLKVAAEALGREIEILTTRGKLTAERGMAMELLHRCCGLSQPAIGRLLGGLDYSSVNRKRFLHALEHDEKLRQSYLKALGKLNIQD